MRREPLAITLANLDAALNFCRSLGLNDEVAQSRFSQYRGHLANLETTRAAQGLAALDNAFQAARPLSVVALTEGTELGGIGPSIGAVKVDPKVLRQKFAQVLRGPLMPEGEDQNTNQGRNILFELNLASKLCRAGIETHIDDQADLWFEHKDRRVLVECKRPFSLKTVRGKFVEAKDQLRSNLTSAAAGSGGIVALSVSRVVNVGILVESTADRIALRLVKQLQSVSSEVFGDSPGASDVGLLGVLFHVTAPALSQEDEVWAVAQETIVQPLTPSGSQDFEFMRNLSGTLQESNV